MTLATQDRTGAPSAPEVPSRAVTSSQRLVTLGVPIALLVGLVALILVINPAARLDTGAPPVEELAFERIVLSPGEIQVTIRNAAGTPNTISQVLVDDAYWTFTADPSPTLGRYQSAVLTIPYPWVAGETHAIAIVTPTGTVFDHEIAVAVATPVPDAKGFGDYALIGALVGVLPVAVGMLFLPAMRRLSKSHYNAVLALTLGVLAFLAVDTVGEGLELAEEAPGVFNGVGIFIASALVAVVAVLGLERAMRARGIRSYALAVLIAVGIGLHNLGEGLIIGSAFALGSITLGTALIAGFAIHNVTEGPAIVSPLARPGGSTLAWKRFLVLAAVAGLPTIAGAWIGAFTSSGLLSIAFFGLGAGAIAVVLVQVGTTMKRAEGGLATPLNMIAFAGGFLIMLATALLLAA